MQVNALHDPHVCAAVKGIQGLIRAGDAWQVVYCTSQFSKASPAQGVAAAKFGHQLRCEGCECEQMF